MTIDDSEHTQDELDAMLNVLSDYTPKRQKYIEAKNKLSDNVKKFYERREKIIKGFKDRIFLLNHDNKFEEKERYEEEIKNIRNENGLIDYNKFMNLIYSKEREISDELVRKHFLVQDLEELLKKLKKLKNNTEKSKIRVNLINSGLRDLNEEIEDMSEEEKETKNPNGIIDIVENILLSLIDSNKDKD